MFGMKKDAVQIKFVNTKTQNDNPQVAEEPIATPQEIADLAMKTIGAVGVAIAANRVLTTICDIAVIAAKAKFK